MNLPEINRRSALKWGTLGAVTLAVGTPFSAQAIVRPSRRNAEPETTDLGPGVTAFALAAGVAVGDVVYIQTRNMDPVRIVGLDLVTQRVVSESVIDAPKGSQAVCGDREGRYVYIGTDGVRSCLHRVDTQAPNEPGVPLVRVPGLDVQSVDVAPDGIVFFSGNGGGQSLLWQYDPATGVSSPIGEMPASIHVFAGVAATLSHVYAGGYLKRADGSLQAVLIAVDRKNNVTSSILPDEMSGHAEIRDVNVIDDRVVVGSRTSGEAFCHLALIDVNDHSSYVLADGINSRYVFRFCGLGGKIYFGGMGGLAVYDPSTNLAKRLPIPGIDVGFTWDISTWNDKLAITSAGNFVAVVDPDVPEGVAIDIVGAGARPDPQLAMGLAADLEYAYVGGNGVIMRHDLATGKTTALPVGGESKNMLLLDGVLYTAQYNPGGIWRYDPRDGRPPRQIAGLPTGQNRGLDVAHDDVNNLLLVGGRSDTLGAGAFGVYDLATSAFRTYVNPIDDRQMVRTVTASDGVAYLGGDLASGSGTVGTVVAFDPVGGRELWRVETGATRGGIGGIAVFAGKLFVMGSKGEFWVIDLTTHRIIHTADVQHLAPNRAQLDVNRGWVYGVSDGGQGRPGGRLFRIDPADYSFEVVVETDGMYYSGPSISIDEDNQIYTMRERNLVRISDVMGRN